MAKIAPKPYAKYRGTARRISEEVPEFVEELWIGKKRQPKKIRKITTFRDLNGDIIERSFDYSNGKIRNRVYTKRTLNINNESVESTTIRDYFIKKTGITLL